MHSVRMSTTSGMAGKIITRNDVNDNNVSQSRNNIKLNTSPTSCPGSGVNLLARNMFLAFVIALAQLRYIVCKLQVDFHRPPGPVHRVRWVMPWHGGANDAGRELEKLLLQLQLKCTNWIRTNMDIGRLNRHTLHISDRTIAYASPHAQSHRCV